MSGNEGSKDNGVYNSSSVGQFLLHFRSAIVQVISIWSVLLNQFGSPNTASNVKRKNFKRLKRFRSLSPTHYQWNLNSLRS